MKLARVLNYALRRFFTDRCQRDAAAIAYRVLFAVGPLAIVLVTIFGLLLQADEIRQSVIDAVVGALPVSSAGREDVEDALTTIASPATAAGLISLLLFAWSASGMMAAIRQGLETAMNVDVSRSLARGKLVDGALVLGAAALVLFTVAVTVLGDIVQKWLSGQLGDVAHIESLLGVLVRIGVFLASVGVVLLLYRFVPARGLRIRDAVVGATVTALLLQAISLAAALIYAKTSNLSVIYGSLTAALFFVYSTYLYASALLFGAEVAALWSQPRAASTTALRRRFTTGALKLALKEARRIT
ncbi:MAG: YihY/virulence factor BrkB family protein [Gaiellaceae bacterium]